jgi:hypothetical protein
VRVVDDLGQGKVARMRTSIALALARTAALAWTAALAQPAVLAAQETPRVQVTDFTVDGNPPPAAYRDLLANAIRPTLSQVEQCYERRLSVSPQVRGDYRLRLWVSARQVIRATPESSVGDRELEECARAAIRQFTLPPQAPEGGATVRFVVRFTRRCAGPRSDRADATADDHESARHGADRDGPRRARSPEPRADLPGGRLRDVRRWTDR